MPYRCTACGTVIDEFRVSCPWCGAWMTATQTTLQPASEPVPLPALVATSREVLRTRAMQFDRLLGGGLVPGSSLLLSGPPGAGKSTLLLQLLDISARKSLYVSGEESLQQLKLRADRLQINSAAIAFMFETSVNSVVACVRREPPKLLVIDSIQTVYAYECGSLPGSVAQIRVCTYMLRRLAQERNMIVLVVGQVTKGMQAAGPKLLEHAVDCVLSLNLCRENQSMRSLAVVKNRFGPAGTELPLRLTGYGFNLRRR